MNSFELPVKDVSDEQLVRYRFQAKNWGELRGRLFINDVEIHNFSSKKSQLSCDDIQNWLMPGDNNIVISITGGGTSNSANNINENDKTPLYERSLHGMSKPEFPNDSNCLWEININELPQATPLLLQYTFTFTSLQVPTSQLWKNAEIVEGLKDKDRDEILSLQQKLVSGFKRGSIESVMDVYKFVMTEEAAMRNEDVSSSVQKVKDEVSFLAEMSQQGLVRFQQEEEVYFNHLVGNRVVQLCSEKGGATVTIRGEEGEFISLNLYASKINGEWNLVRR